jgi:hypothetical protein
MGRIISPNKEALARLRTPLEKGEKMALDIFEVSLSDDWEIYVQPHLNGCRPDIVLLNPNVGIAVFEVKDWDLDAMEYRVQENRAGSPKLLAKRDGREFLVKNPRAQVARYKREIFEVFCPRLDSRMGLAAITAGLIFPFADEEKLNQLMTPLGSGINLYQSYDPVSGAQSIGSGDIIKVFPESSRSSSSYMNADLADDLRSWLVEPTNSSEQREPLQVDQNQRDLINSRTATGYRRIRGPAGAGKSVVIAAKAAQLASAGKTVLVVSFNITLLHYLRDLCARWPVGHPNQITWLNFHSLCKRTAEELGLFDRYLELWKNHFEDEQHNPYGGGDILGTEIPRLILNQLIETPLVNEDRYDAILVDEGQDFFPLWWDVLRKMCKDEGEMILAADMTQDVYGTSDRWTDAVMAGAGFRGPWSELAASYRLPPEVLDAATQFAKKLLPPQTTLLPQHVPDQSELDITPCELKWVQTSKQKLDDLSVKELFELIVTDTNRDRAIADLTLLTDSIDHGLKIVSALKEKGVNTVHTFSHKEAGREDRRKKLGFWKGDARVKVTTLHSFKGWESRLLVLCISKVRTQRDLALFYTGITRLKRHPLGSCLTVVCAEEKLKDIGKTWSTYRELS